jgi:hypothetical protein
MTDKSNYMLLMNTLDERTKDMKDGLYVDLGRMLMSMYNETIPDSVIVPSLEYENMTQYLLEQIKVLNIYNKKLEIRLEIKEKSIIDHIDISSRYNNLFSKYKRMNRVYKQLEEDKNMLEIDNTTLREINKAIKHKIDTIKIETKYIRIPSSSSSTAPDNKWKCNRCLSILSNSYSKSKHQNTKRCKKKYINKLNIS